MLALSPPLERCVAGIGSAIFHAHAIVQLPSWSWAWLWTPSISWTSLGSLATLVFHSALRDLLIVARLFAVVTNPATSTAWPRTCEAEGAAALWLLGQLVTRILRAPFAARLWWRLAYVTRASDARGANLLLDEATTSSAWLINSRLRFLQVVESGAEARARGGLGRGSAGQGAHGRVGVLSLTPVCHRSSDRRRKSSSSPYIES